MFQKIRDYVATIPRGKVVTYGQVASIVGCRSPQVVGWAIRNNQNPLIPCHRVVRKDGTLAPNFSLGGWQEQRRRLLADGVTFIHTNQVDLTVCQYEV